jgi:hypothetical protein
MYLVLNMDKGRRVSHRCYNLRGVSKPWHTSRLTLHIQYVLSESSILSMLSLCLLMHSSDHRKTRDRRLRNTELVKGTDTSSGSILVLVL